MSLTVRRMSLKLMSFEGLCGHLISRDFGKPILLWLKDTKFGGKGHLLLKWALLKCKLIALKTQTHPHKLFKRRGSWEPMSLVRAIFNSSTQTQIFPIELPPRTWKGWRARWTGRYTTYRRGGTTWSTTSQSAKAFWCHFYMVKKKVSWRLRDTGR